MEAVDGPWNRGGYGEQDARRLATLTGSRIVPGPVTSGVAAAVPALHVTPVGDAV